MIRVKEVDEQRQHQRVDAKSPEAMFRRRIEQGANCAPFVSEAILQAVKEVFDLEARPEDQLPRIGQLRFVAICASEPPGKTLDQCQKVEVTLTLDAGSADQQVRLEHGVGELRRTRLLRLCTEARDQGGLLSYEDLAFRLLNCGLRTIVRDAETIRARGLYLPSRGQQQDMGPRQTHRAKAVELFLAGHEPKQIARRIYHALSSVENYLTTFARVVVLVEKEYCEDEIAMLIQRSPTLVAAYRQLYLDHREEPAAQQRLQEILKRVATEHPEKRGIQS